MQLASGRRWLNRMPSRTRNGFATTGTSGGVTAVIGGTLTIDPVAVGRASLPFRLIQASDGSIWREHYLTPSAGLLGTALKISLRSFIHTISELFNWIRSFSNAHTRTESAHALATQQSELARYGKVI